MGSRRTSMTLVGRARPRTSAHEDEPLAVAFDPAQRRTTYRPNEPPGATGLSPGEVLRLQRSVGNRAVTTLLEPPRSSGAARTMGGAVVQRAPGGRTATAPASRGGTTTLGPEDDLAYRGPGRGYPGVAHDYDDDYDNDYDDDLDGVDLDGENEQEADYAPGAGPTLGDFLRGPLSQAEERLAEEARQARARAEAEEELRRQAELEAEAEAKAKEQALERERVLAEEKRRAEEEAALREAAEQERLRKEAKALEAERKKAEAEAQARAEAELRAKEEAARLKAEQAAVDKAEALRSDLDGMLAAEDLAGKVTPEEYDNLLSRLKTLRVNERKTGKSATVKKDLNRAKNSFDTALAGVRGRLTAEVEAQKEKAAALVMQQDFEADKQAMRDAVGSVGASGTAQAVLTAVLDPHTLGSGFDATVDRSFSVADLLDAHDRWLPLYNKARQKRTMKVIGKVWSPGYAPGRTAIAWKERGSQWECTLNFCATIGKHTSNVHVQPSGGKPKKKSGAGTRPAALGKK